MEISIEFKEALQLLSSKEKDKLVIRLLKKDKILAEKLHYELVEGKTVEEKRSELFDNLKEYISINQNKLDDHYDLVFFTRVLSSKITHYLKIVKDKYGEIESTVFILLEILKIYTFLSKENSQKYTHKIDQILVPKFFRLFMLLNALDEDYRADFNSDLELIEEEIKKNNPLLSLCERARIKLEWFSETEREDDIKALFNKSKEEGLFKK